jgi:hypothetical protein
VSEYLEWVTKLNGRLNGTDGIAASQLDLVQPSRSLTVLPASVIGGSWPKDAYRHAPRIRYRAHGAGAWTYQQITDLELSNFQILGPQLNFDITSDDANMPFLFSLAGGQLIQAQGGAWESEIMTHQDDWVDLAAWLSLHPPAFFAADKSSFQGMNAFPPPSLVTTKLAESDTESVDWAGCNIAIEFEADKAGGLLTVHQHLQNRLANEPNLEALVYDHRSGEAADFIAVTKDDVGHCTVSLYHCKGAGGAPSGGRVNDVYEVTCQLLKSVAYCDAELLAKHVEHRINPDRHVNPSTFIVGDLDALKAILYGTPADKLSFAIYGVQPGISKAAVDEHLADLMAFSLDYVHRGGAAKGVWLINA